MITGDFNVVDILQEKLEEQIRFVITEQFIQEKLDEFERQLREKVEATVNRVCIDKVEKMQNLLDLQEKINVYVSINDKRQGEKNERK
jgi:rRNA-processing protein FCF1